MNAERVRADAALLIEQRVWAPGDEICPGERFHVNTVWQSDLLRSEFASAGSLIHMDGRDNSQMMNAGDLDRTEQDFQEKLAKGRDPETLANYALFLQTARNDREQAGKLFSEALNSDPDSPEYLRLYAVFLGKSDDGREKARSLFQKALSIAPDHPDLLINYAFFLRRTGGDLAEIDGHYEKSLSENPEDPALLVEYASYLKAFRGEAEKAEELFRRALAALPESRARMAEQYISLLDVGPSSGSEGGAEALYRRALEEKPENVTARMRYAAWLWLQNRNEAASEQMDKALELCQDGELAICLHFYRYAHQDFRPAENGEPAQSLMELRRLVDKGSKKDDFLPEANVMRAIANGHPEPALLKMLAEVVTGKTAAKKLARFPAWPVGRKQG